MMFPKIPKNHVKPIVKDLDALVSRIVIKRDGKCVLCGSKMALGSGHWIRRRYYGTRWDLDNCHCLCNICNARDDIDAAPYTNWMTNNVGQSVIYRLVGRKNDLVKPVQQHQIYQELLEVAKRYGV